MKIHRKRITRFQAFIFSWWKFNKRDLPWRRTRDPYRILVSEVMLQQTQVSRVLPKYEEFLYFFPDVYTLARASPANILRVWKGMGYNRRALYLKKAAETVVKRYGGEFPDDEAKLITLPGVGIYTARALLVFAFGQDVAAVDTNIRQIITHVFFRDVAQKPSVIQEVADRLVPAGEAWEWHQALMDYGALELPKLKVHKRTKTAGTPFTETNRYYRGRVIDALRAGNRREQVLLHEFHTRYGKPEHVIASLIDGLVGDGLAERKNGTLRLPG